MSSIYSGSFDVGSMFLFSLGVGLGHSIIFMYILMSDEYGHDWDGCMVSGWDGFQRLYSDRGGPFLRGGKPLERLQKTEGQKIERFES